MPLFHFHLRADDGIEPDEIGLDLPDLEAAYREACAAIPGMAAEFLRDGQDPMARRFVIATATGETLMEVPFGERLRGVARSSLRRSAATAPRRTRCP